MPLRNMKHLNLFTALIFISFFFSSTIQAQSNSSLFDVMKNEALQSCKKSPPKALPSTVDVPKFCACYSTKIAELGSMKMMGMLSDKEMEEEKVKAVKECSAPDADNKDAKSP